MDSSAFQFIVLFVFHVSILSTWHDSLRSIQTITFNKIRIEANLLVLTRRRNKYKFLASSPSKCFLWDWLCLPCDSWWIPRVLLCVLAWCARMCYVDLAMLLLFLWMNEERMEDLCDLCDGMKKMIGEMMNAELFWTIQDWNRIKSDEFFFLW